MLGKPWYQNEMMAMQKNTSVSDVSEGYRRPMHFGVEARFLLLEPPLSCTKNRCEAPAVWPLQPCWLMISWGRKNDPLYIGDYFIIQVAGWNPGWTGNPELKQPPEYWFISWKSPEFSEAAFYKLISCHGQETLGNLVINPEGFIIWFP